jgi:hypothetical protein
MSERASRLERFFERAFDIAPGTGAHPAELLQRVHSAAEASIRDGVIANAYTVSLDKRNASAFLPHRQNVVDAIERMLDDLARTRQVRRLAPWSVEVLAKDSVAGGVDVRAEFRNERGSAPDVAGVTRAIQRQRGIYLRVDGDERVKVTHTPFTIGRGRECDLALADMAISRRHAVIEEDATGFVVRDLGSRNQIAVDSGTVAVLPLRPGTLFRLGGITFTFEVTDER